MTLTTNLNQPTLANGAEISEGSEPEEEGPCSNNEQLSEEITHSIAQKLVVTTSLNPVETTQKTIIPEDVGLRPTLSPELPKLVFGCADESKITHRKLITVCMHGDEFCGMVAVNELIKEGLFNVTHSEAYATTRLTVILGNPKAVLANKRFIDVNLNRIFHEQRIRRESAKVPETPIERDSLFKTHYEVSRVQAIADEISDCDEYIDIHSTSARSSPFALPALDRESEEFAREFSVDFVIEKLVRSVVGTSIGWAHALHKKAVCFECGQHDDRSTVETAKRIIARFVANLISGTAKAVLTCPANEHVRKGFRYAKTRPPNSFEKVNYRELLAYDEEVGEIRCNNPQGAYIIMPTASPILGEEAWFWGELTEGEQQFQPTNVQVQTEYKVNVPFLQQPFKSMNTQSTIEVHS
jgi:succinylglutamate desuccinylase